MCWSGRRTGEIGTCLGASFPPQLAACDPGGTAGWGGNRTPRSCRLRFRKVNIQIFQRRHGVKQGPRLPDFGPRAAGQPRRWRSARVVGAQPRPRESGRSKARPPQRDDRLLSDTGGGWGSFKSPRGVENQRGLGSRHRAPGRAWGSCVQMAADET